MIGSIGILNVGVGDTKLTFDPAKPEETRRAAAVVEDMLRRGFAILVQVGERNGKPLFQRAESFDPETCEYIIVGTPPAPPPPAAEGDDGTAPAEAVADTNEAPRQRKSRKGVKYGAYNKTRVPAASTRAVAVARSAGG